MKLNKLLGSQTKVDILKFLIFFKEGVSVRALETYLGWSFPAIKKQVDILLEAGLIEIEKNSTSWAIYLKKEYKPVLRKLFLFSLWDDILIFFKQNPDLIKKYYLGNIFGYEIGPDLVVIYNSDYKYKLEFIKTEIDKIVTDYFITNFKITFFSDKEFETRYRIGDRFIIFLQNKGGQQCKL